MAVEFAIVAVPMFLVIMICFEFCRGMMVVSTMEEAVRAGCRVAILRGATVAEVEDEVESFLDISGVECTSVVVTPSSLEAPEQWDPVSVTVHVTLGEMCWVPLPRFFKDRVCSASCTLPKEGNRGT